MSNFKIVKDKELGKIFFPPGDIVISETIKHSGCWEPEEINWLKKTIKPGMSCINVGANVGYHTIIMSKLTGKDGSVFSFEPSPSVFPFLEKNILNQKLSNVDAYRLAVGNYNGDVEFYENIVNCGDNRCFDPSLILDKEQNYGFEDLSIRPIKVPIVTLDSMFLQTKIDLIFTDAQGFDLLIIDGAIEIIKKYMPIIFFEYVPSWSDAIILNHKDIFIKIINLGYRLFDIDGNDVTQDVLSNTHEYKVGFYENPVGFYENFVFYPNLETKP